MKRDRDRRGRRIRPRPPGPPGPPGGPPGPPDPPDDPPTPPPDDPPTDPPPPDDPPTDPPPPDDPPPPSDDVEWKSSSSGLYLLGQVDRVPSQPPSANQDGYNFRCTWEAQQIADGDFSVLEASLLSCANWALEHDLPVSVTFMDIATPQWVLASGVETYDRAGQNQEPTPTALPWDPTNMALHDAYLEHAANVMLPGPDGKECRLADHPYFPIIGGTVPGLGGVRDKPLASGQGGLSSSPSYSRPNTLVAFQGAYRDYQAHFGRPERRIYASWFGWTDGRESQYDGVTMVDWLFEQLRPEFFTGGEDVALVSVFIENVSCSTPAEGRGIIVEERDNHRGAMVQMLDGFASQFNPRPEQTTACIDYTVPGDPTSGGIRGIDRVIQQCFDRCGARYYEVYDRDFSHQSEQEWRESMDAAHAIVWS